ncbi:serine hydrolase [Parachlamydia acanthamoebae]|uniref:serine hydrolase n=1 Tax=Parachlamydia acanthamoebae TaxID=83552 RepID=UPI0007507212|nr:serine hydrolase [Parachlamydia acanthamoebae]
MCHIFFYTFLFLLASFVQAENSKQNPALIIEQTIQKYMQEKQIPGMAIALYYNQKPYFFNFGFADDLSNQSVTSDTLFEIASLTKVFTSTALAIQILKSKMRLSDPVIKYLPNVQKRLQGIGKVTLLQLATHTSGLPRIPPRLPPHRGKKYHKNSVLHFLSEWQPDRPPGEHYSYSNLGYGVLGYAIADVENKHYGDSIKEHILEPLFMKSTFLIVPHAYQELYAQGYTKEGNLAERSSVNAWPAGCALRSTSRDLLKFLMASLGIEGPQELMQAMELTQKSFFKINDQLSIGLGWQKYTTDKLLFVDKNGQVPGFSSYIGLLPNQKIGIVLLANKGKTQITKTGRDLLERLFEASQMK